MELKRLVNECSFSSVEAERYYIKLLELYYSNHLDDFLDLIEELKKNFKNCYGVCWE